MRSNIIEPSSPALPSGRTNRLAHVQAPQFAFAQAAQPPAAAMPRSRPGIASHEGRSVHLLRDQYTAHCLKNAVLAHQAQQARLHERAIAANQAQRDEQTALQARADAANDLGTIQGLLPQQLYRHAVGVPPIVAQQFTAPADVGPAPVGPVANIAKMRSRTENASDAERRHSNGRKAEG